MFRYLGVLGLAGLGAIAWAQTFTAPTSYSVTVINSMMGVPVTMHIYRDGAKAVIDNQNGDTHVRALYDLTAHTNYSWDVKDPSSGCGSATWSGDWGDPFTSDDLDQMLKSATRPAANETLLGFSTQVWEATDPKSKTRIKVWRELKSGLFVKVDMAPPGGADTTIIQVKEYSPMKPGAAVFEPPPACKTAMSTPPVKPQSATDQFAAEIGGADADYVDATRGPGSPNSCTMLLRLVGPDLRPLTNFQVALDLDLDLDHPPDYVMGGSPSGKTVFSGGGLKEYTGQVHNGLLRLDNVPDHFEFEATFAGGNKGASSALVYRHCAGPQTVLLYVLKSPDNPANGSDLMWVKSGKLATVEGH